MRWNSRSVVLHYQFMINVLYVILSRRSMQPEKITFHFGIDAMASCLYVATHKARLMRSVVETNTQRFGRSIAGDRKNVNFKHRLD
jgi:hypothetical protein